MMNNIEASNFELGNEYTFSLLITIFKVDFFLHLKFFTVKQRNRTF